MVQKITEIVQNLLADTEIFLVDLNVDKNDKIIVEVDTLSGIQLDQCAALSKNIDEQLMALDLNYALEVSSPGLTKPLKVHQQYVKNLNRNLDLILMDNTKMTGKLLTANEDSIVLEIKERERLPHQKKAHLVIKEITIPLSEIKSTKVSLSF